VDASAPAETPAGPAPAAGAPAPPPYATRARNTAPLFHALPERPAKNHRQHSAARTNSADRAGQVAFARLAPSPVTPALPDPPAIVHASAVSALPKVIAARLGPAGAERIVAFVKPAPSSSLRGAFRKVLGGKGNQDFVPASPVDHPMPSVDAKAPVPEGDGAKSLEMEAKIDRQGNVVHVKVVGSHDPLSVACASALYRWRFDPARQNGEPVDSEMLVRFEFSFTR
jgi:hypothetical protein